jgi:tripartite ATP-independent transporter DctP family solute receptor
VPNTAAMELPFVFRSAQHAYTVLDGAVGSGVLNELAPHGMKGLAYWENGWRAFTNNKRPVNKPEDLKGLKIRSTPNPYHIQAFKLLGMNPSPMPIAELYTALETGTFDAQEHPINVTWSSKFYEVQKHLTVSNHVYSPLIVAMNKGKFDSLPANYQTIVVEAAREAAKYQRGLNAANAGKVIADLKKLRTSTWHLSRKLCQPRLPKHLVKRTAPHYCKPSKTRSNARSQSPLLLKRAF